MASVQLTDAPSCEAQPTRVWTSFAKGTPAAGDVWDLAALFATHGTTSSDEQKRILVRPIAETTAGTFLQQIPVADAERVLLELVTVDLYLAWTTAPQLGGLENPFAERGYRMPTNTVAPQMFDDDEFALEVSTYANAKRGRSDPVGAAAFEELRVRFCKGLARALAESSPDARRISIAHIDDTRGEDASRLLRVIAAAVRDEARSPAWLDLEAALHRPQNAATLASLAELLVLHPVTDGQLSIRPQNHEPTSLGPLSAALWKSLPGRARVERDVGGHLIQALTSVLSSSVRDGVLDLDAVQRKLGTPAVELVVSLLRDAGPLTAGPSSWVPVLWSDIDAALSVHDGIPPARSALFANTPVDTATSLGDIASFLLRTPLPALGALVRAVWQGDPMVFGVHPDTLGAPPLAMEKIQERFRATLRRGGGDGAVRDEHLAAVALIELFADVVDASGALDLDRLRRTYGDPIANLALRLQASANALPGADPLRGAGTTSLSADALAKIGASISLEDVRERMPVYRSLLPELREGAPLSVFSGSAVLQHLLPPACIGIQGLEEMGIDASSLALLGKSYSTKDAGFAWLAARGYDVHPASRGDDNVAEDAKARLSRAGREILRKLFAGVTAAEMAEPKPKRRFLIVDEGGVFLKLLHTDPELTKFAKLCVAVEHTENGMQMLDDLREQGVALQVPVVAMARCHLKKQVEAAAIGESIVDEAERMVEELPAEARPTGKTAALLGYGDVGKHVARALTLRGYRVTAFDVAPEARDRARAAGFVAVDANDKAARNASLKQNEYVFSVTGRPTLATHEYGAALADGAIGVVGGSGNHELGVGALTADERARETRQERVDASGLTSLPFQGQHVATGSYFDAAKNRHLVFRSKDPTTNAEQEALILYGGGVVNLRRGLPPEHSQLIRLLVLASAKEAARIVEDRDDVGIYDVPEDIQEKIRAGMDEYLTRERYGTLDAPDFRALRSW